MKAANVSWLVAACLLLASPVAAAEPPTAGDVIDCVKNTLDCSTMDQVIWVVRCVGDSLNGHHCTQE